MSEISLKNIKKHYAPNINVINGIDLDIRDREFLVLLGSSGCGKSTLLRMIAGIESINCGELLIDQVLVNDVEPQKRNIAMVFQNYALYPHMSVYKNMAFGLKIAKLDKAEIGERIAKASDILGLNDLLDRYPSELSGGQRQRVAIGRAIVKEPKVFLMDEPLSNLDAKLRNHMRLEIKKLHQRLDCTFVYVTHDQVEAVTLGDRIAVMEKGLIVQVATPKEIIERPVNKFVAGFIGSPQMNFFEAVFENDRVLVSGTKIALSNRYILSNGKKIIVGIRPEHCSIGMEPRLGSVRMRVEICEMMGTDMIVHLIFNEGRFVVKALMEDSFEAGAEVFVDFETGKLHIFDAYSEFNLLEGVV